LPRRFPRRPLKSYFARILRFASIFAPLRFPTLCRGSSFFTFKEWKDLLIRSVGLEPSILNERTCDVMLLRMVPFVENNYNAVELGPRGTGKSHLYQQVSPYAHLVSGGKATVAKMFVNNASGHPRRQPQGDYIG
jgi:ATP-dependent Lon protease